MSEEVKNKLENELLEMGYDPTQWVVSLHESYNLSIICIRRVDRTITKEEMELIRSTIVSRYERITYSDIMGAPEEGSLFIVVR